jgi:excisionase family DNA binding protein
VPAEDVDAVVQQLFKDFDVWRMYADPPYWQSWIATWRGMFGEERVIEWFTTRRLQMAAALENFDTAIREGRLSHDGDRAILLRHLANAHRKNLHDAQRTGPSALADSEGTPRLAFQDRLDYGGVPELGSLHRCHRGRRAPRRGRRSRSGLRSARAIRMKPSAKVTPEVVSLQRAARLLNVHEDTIRNWAKRGTIRIERVGKKLLRVPVSELVRLNLQAEDCDSPIAPSARGYVYFVESAGLIKIGVTAYPTERVKSLQAQSATSVVLRGLIPFDTYTSAQRAEIALHERYRHRRRHGEWFAITERDVVAALAAIDSDADSAQLLRTDPNNATA